MEPRGWAVDEEERAAQDRRLGGLVGRRIDAVRCVELSCDAPTWEVETCDSLDYGLELDLDDGSTWSVTWTPPGNNLSMFVYEDTLRPGQISPEADVAEWDVTDRWHEHGMSGVAGITTVWGRHEYGPTRDREGNIVRLAHESDLCLLTLILTAPDGAQAVLTLGEDTGSGHRHIPDNIAVFFSIEDAHQLGVVLPGTEHAVAVGP